MNRERRVRGLRITTLLPGLALAGVVVVGGAAMESGFDLADGSGTFSSEAAVRRAARTATAATSSSASLPASARVAFGDWTFAGPRNVGAEVVSLAAGAAASELYALSPKGTIFRSIDRGGHWTGVATVPPPGHRMRQLAVLAGSANLPLTFFVVDDFGSNGVVFAIAQDGTPELVFSSASKVVVSGQVAYAVGALGLHRSVDAGSTWEALVSGSECSDVVASGPRVYAICDNIVYRGANGGAFAGVGSSDQRGGQLAVSRSNPDVVYRSVSAGNGGAWIYRSDDAGQTWEASMVPWDDNPMHQALLTDFQAECAGTMTFAPDRYAFAVDPLDENVLWIGAYHLYRSDDGGLTFGRASLDPAGRNDGHGLPAGSRDIVFAADYDGALNTTMYVATSGGVHATANGSASLQTSASTSCDGSSGPPEVAWARLTDGYSAHQMLRSEVTPTGEILAQLGGNEPAGLYYGDLLDPDGWGRLSKEQPQAFTVDPVQGVDRFYTSPCTTGTVCRWDWVESSGRWEITESPFIPEGGNVLDRLHTLSIDPHNPDRIWSAAPYRAIRSDDAGATWGYKDNTPRGWGISLVAVSPHDPNLVFLAGGGDRVYRRTDALATDAGSVWPATDLGIGNWQARAIAFDPAKRNHVFISGALAPSVFASRDAGQTWQAADVQGAGDGLPDSDVLSLAVDVDVGDVVYAGTTEGLYVSWNVSAVGGSVPVWFEVPTPFDGVAVRNLVMRKAADGSRRLYVFTDGRGIWSVPVRAAPFNDVGFTRWSHDVVARLYRTGITGGCGTYPMRYCPESPVLREQMAVFLLRAKHGRTYQPPTASGDFSDVATNHWAAAWIERLREEGITTGCGTQPLRFCPGNPVRRDEIAVFLLRAKYGASYQPPAASGLFADVPTGNWAAAWIEQLAREGIAGGCGSQKYCPGASVTREQMAAFLVRAFGL